MLCYFVVQARSLHVNSRQIHAARAVTAEAASRLHHLGLRPPCFLYGHDAVQIAYLARCAAHGVFRNYGGTLSVPSSIRAAMSRGDRVGVLTTSRRPPARFLNSWIPIDLRLGSGKKRYVFLPPQAEPAQPGMRSACRTARRPGRATAPSPAPVSGSSRIT